MKNVLITGVGKGIGHAVMSEFLRENHYVMGAYHTKKPDFKNDNAILFPLDLTKLESINSCVHEIFSLDRKINILINNAGVLLDEEETSVIDEKLRGTLEVNLIGTANFTERLLPLLIPGGHIINISSSAGSLALPATHDHYPYHYPSYKISKAALNMYTRTLAARLENQNITVSSVHPGWVKTDMGGPEAEREPEEAAKDIFMLANSHVETGQFWFKGEKFPW